MLQLNIDLQSDIIQNPDALGLSPNLSTPGGIISELLPIALMIAGLILFGMLVSGGFQVMTAVQDPSQADAGKKKISAAVIGFLLLFSSYWIAQLMEVLFGISILG